MMMMITMSATSSALLNSTLFCVAWICLLGPVLSSSITPVYLLPFSNSTYAYDVMAGVNGEYSDSRECPEFETSYPEFDYGVLVFKGRGSYVEFEMKKLKLDYLTFSIFVYPYNTTGVILQYEADEGDKKDTLHTLTIELDDGRVKLTVKNGSNSILANISSRDLVVTRQWYFIAGSKENQTYWLHVNLQRSSQTDNKPKVSVETKGDLNIARDHSSSSLSPYKGRLSCLAVWKDKLPDRWDFGKWCKEQEWPRKPLIPDTIVKQTHSQESGQDPNPTCTATVPPVTARVTHLWPLSLSSNGYDVVNNMKPSTDASFQCFFTSHVTYPATNRSVIYLDGSVISYLEAVVPASAVTNDVTIAIAVRPDCQVEGVIWDIQIPGTDQGWRLRLSLTNGSAVFAILNRTDTCSKVTSKNRIRGNHWSFLSTMLVFTNNTMSIHSDSALESTALNCRPSFAANRSASIRIGQTFDPQLSTVGYHGSAACLAVVDGVVDGSTIRTLVEARCKDMDKRDSFVGKENCSDRQGVKGTRFRMTASGMCPSEQSASSNSSVMSLLKCSTVCTTYPECRSFAYNTNSSTDNCRVYHFVTRSGLLADEGCNYYSVARD